MGPNRRTRPIWLPRAWRVLKRGPKSRLTGKHEYLRTSLRMVKEAGEIQGRIDAASYYSAIGYSEGLLAAAGELEKHLHWEAPELTNLHRDLCRTAESTADSVEHLVERLLK